MSKGRILIAGASGFIGSNVRKHFLRGGYTVHSIVRPAGVSKDPDAIRLEDLHSDGLPEDTTAVFNFCGKPIVPFPEVPEVVNSRVSMQTSLVDAINQSDVKPKSYISSSGLGFFPTGLDTTQPHLWTESSYPVFFQQAEDSSLSQVDGQSVFDRLRDNPSSLSWAPSSSVDVDSQQIDPQDVTRHPLTYADAYLHQLVAQWEAPLQQLDDSVTAVAMRLSPVLGIERKADQQFPSVSGPMAPIFTMARLGKNALYGNRFPFTMVALDDVIEAADRIVTGDDGGRLSGGFSALNMVAPYAEHSQDVPPSSAEDTVYQLIDAYAKENSALRVPAALFQVGDKIMDILKVTSMVDAASPVMHSLLFMSPYVESEYRDTATSHGVLPTSCPLIETLTGNEP